MICTRVVGRRTQRSLSVWVLAVAAAIAGCAPSEPLGPTATVPQGTTTTNPYAVPAVIDEAYVNRVLAALDHSVGEVTRQVVAGRAVTPEVRERLEAIYEGRYLAVAIGGYEYAIQLGMPGFREQPGDRRSRVTRLISATPSCIFAEIHRDLSEVGEGEKSTPTEWVALVAVTMSVSPFNPTPWKLIYDGFDEGFKEPANPCSRG